MWINHGKIQKNISSENSGKSMELKFEYSENTEDLNESSKTSGTRKIQKKFNQVKLREKLIKWKFEKTRRKEFSRKRNKVKMQEKLCICEFKKNSENWKLKKLWSSENSGKLNHLKIPENLINF